MSNFFKRNRYDAAEVAGAFAGVLKSLSQGKSELPSPVVLSYEVEGAPLELYFSKSAEFVRDLQIERAREVCSGLTEFDNQVQQSCESDFQRSRPDQSYKELLEKQGLSEDAAYALHLAYITIGVNSAKLHYYGTFVNTEWDAEFARDEFGSWQKVNF